MKITYTFFVYLSILFLGMPVVFSLNDSEKGLILKNFKNQEREMIFESNANLVDEEDTSIIGTYRKLNIYNNIGDKIQSKREYLESQNKKIANRVQSLEASIEDLDSDVVNLVAEINNINEQIINIKQKVDTNKKTITLLKEKIAQSTEILVEYLVYLYKKGEYVSSKNEIDNLKTILLSGEKVDEVINDLYFQSIIQVTGQKLIRKHRDYISKLYIKKIELQKDEEQLRILRKTGILEKNILDDKRSAKQRLLEVTKGQEDLYAKYISDKLSVEKDIKIKELREQIKLNNSKKKLLDRYNCDFVDISTQELLLSGLSEQCVNINKIIYAESRLTSIPQEYNPLNWPVSPRLGISAFFRDEEYVNEFGTNHDAIDIVIPQGTEITAPMDGYVIYIQPPVNTGYAYVGLKHSDGLVTLYGHVSKVLVGRYDFVKQGDVFALSGGEYGTLGAGILTTGPHLHFVVYENETYADPLEYLDTSYLPYSILPTRYEFKYKADFRSRKGYEYTRDRQDCSKSGVFCIEGETEIERQKNLLNIYAVGPFRDWDIWVEESVSGGIDPTFMMCVGLAETSLGKHLKTAYNIGNVGNTDSGSTYTFTNARQGIHWMIKTFNNRFLSQYNEIQELSRYGNKDESKPIYASSDFNWHNNITKCMGHVKGTFVSDNYKFRLSR